MAKQKTPTCSLCGDPMPPGEEMFKFHGYSGPCPKPPLPKPEVPSGHSKTYADAFQRTYPNLRLDKDEKEELERLFAVCRRDARRDWATTQELDVIEAAQDWANAQEGSKYGPMQNEIRCTERALMDRVADLAAENDGRWERPKGR